MPLSLRTLVLLAGSAGTLTACAGTAPVSYSGLAAAPRLTANQADTNGHIPFRYAAASSDLSHYSSVILDPVAVYDGPDQQFGHMDADDRATLAAYMQTQFSEALKAHYTLANTTGPATLRVHVTLTGAETNVAVLSAVTKILPGGAVINTVQSVRDKQAAMSGSVSYAVEAYDSASGQLLRAYITKQYPFAENIAASFGTLSASRAGIRVGARDLVAQLN